MCPQQWECSRQWGKCPQQWGKCPQQWGEMSATVGGNVHDSGEIDHGLENSKVEIAIHNVAKITSEDTWNNM